MEQTLAHKIIKAHLLKGELAPGSEITLRVDQTLTQDSTGTMVYLQLDALEPDKIRTDLSVAYVDHNLMQAGFENADDHAFIQSVCKKYGIKYVKPGGGICHQVHLERFAIPGTTLIGSDSHTPTAGGMGSLAIGAGGLDVALGMATGEYTLTMPRIYGIELVGEPAPYINGKDIILTVLQKLTVKGGVGNIMEYYGEGLRHLSVPTRATITNMGAELGATTSLFPSDENTKDYLRRQGREEDWQPLAADAGAPYDFHLKIDLSEVVPMVAKPHSPDNVVPVKEIEGIKIDQIAIGSCTNSSYSDLMRVARILKGHRVHPDVSLVISPGSAQVLKLMAENGALATFVQAGARILESACGPCIGMGQAPKSGGVSMRSFNRNFKGRSGTADAQVYLLSPETAAVSAIYGVLTDPASVDVDLQIPLPESFGAMPEYLIDPEGPEKDTPVQMGPNIQPVPVAVPLPDRLEATVLLVAGDNVTTDDIAPSNANLLPLRSNVPKLSQYTFRTLTPDFKARAEAAGAGAVVAGDNYGQGSSREHAALLPLYLGVKFVLAKSFARIHRSNLINVGLLPLVFENPEDYDKIPENAGVILENIHASLESDGKITLRFPEQNLQIPVLFSGTPGETATLLAGGKLRMAKESVKGGTIQ